MEDNASVPHERASESGRVHGWGNGEDGKQMAVALSHQHNRRGTQDGHRPPPHINSIQGDALSSRQHDTFLTTSSPCLPRQPLITLYWRCWINHLGTYSLTLESRVEPIAYSLKMGSRWGNIFLKMRQNKIGFKMTGQDLPDVPCGWLWMRLRRLWAACLGDNLQQPPIPRLSSQCRACTE